MRIGTIRANHFKSVLFRIDPSFYLSEGIKTRSMLNNAPYRLSTVGESSERVFIGNIFSRVFVNDEKHGIPYLAASDTVLANLETGRYLSHRQASELSYLILQKDWILATCSGTIGNVSYTNKEFAGKIATHDLIRIVPNDENVLRGCLYAFLASKYGYYQMTESKFGGVVKHINADYASAISVPVFPMEFQIKVDSLIKESARLREVSIEALYASHKIVESYFPAVPSKNNCQSVSIKDIWSSQAHRMESSYHIADGKFYDAFIRDNFLWKPLGDVSKSISRPDIFKRMYVDNGITFLGGTDIMLSIPDSKKKLSKKTPHIDDFMVDEGWILLPRSGTIGDVVYTTSQHAQKLVSEDVIRIIPNDILSGGYVFAFLSSKIGRALIQRPIFGSVIQHVEPPLLKTMPIPVIEDEKMEEISDLAETYRSAWGEACKKELEAISLVEAEIEKWNK